MVIDKKDKQLFLNEIKGTIPLKKQNKPNVIIKPIHFKPKIEINHKTSTNKVIIDHKKNNKKTTFTIEELTDPIDADGYKSKMLACLTKLSYSKNIKPNLFNNLKKGKVYPDKTLDLHGFTVEEAKINLVSFLNFAKDKKLKCVIIIHGKGQNSQSEPAKLKTCINHWLRQFHFVTAFCSCTPKDGDTGAVYVLLSQ